MQSTSVSLLERLHTNTDPAAWERFNSLYGPFIRGWLQRHGIRPSDGDDLIQEVLVTVVEKFPQFNHNQRTGAFRAWLKAIVWNKTRDYWKSNRLRPAATGQGIEGFGAYLDQLADSSSGFSQQWDREHDLYVTRRLLELIQPEFEAKTWEAFRRFAIEGQSSAEVAEALGMSPGAVYVAKSRILARLQEEAKGFVGDD